MSSSDETCGDFICTQIGQSCFESCSESCESNCEEYGQRCSESCSENCEQACSSACQDACDQSCQNACSSSNVLFPSFIRSFFLLSSIIFTLFIAILVGILQAFDPKGPIVITIIGSSILSINLSGIRLTKTSSKFSCKEIKDDEKSLFSSKIRWLTIQHSHHPKRLIERGHEFRIASKYFCTGCYGLFIGTFCAIIIASLYIFFGLSKMWALVILPIIPFFFIPIILRYTLYPTMRTPMRLLANSFIPIGWCIMSISLDALFHNWAINVLMIIIVVSSAYIRSIIATKDNSR